MPTKRKRQRQQHDDLWNLYVQACGSRCCVCSATGVKLQRAHIQRDADGGPGEISNLIPVCASCNGKHTRDLFTHHIRPADWESRFIKLLIRHFNLKVSMAAEGGSSLREGGSSLGDGKPADSKVVIPLEKLILEANSEVPASLRTSPLPVYSMREITEVTRAAIRLGNRHKVPLSLPGKKVLGDMERIAKTRGPKAFMAAAKEFLAQGTWFEMRGDFPSRTMPHHEWERFCDNFELFLGDHKARLEREAAEAEAIRQMDERIRREEEAQRKRESDPEYIRQREEEKKASSAAAALRKKERARKLAVDALAKRFNEEWQSLGDFTTEQEEMYYEIKRLLEKMRTCDDDTLLGRYAQDFDPLIRKLKTP